MGWFSKKREVLDLTDRYRKQQGKLAAKKEEAGSSGSAGSSGGFGIFGMGGFSNASSDSGSGYGSSGSSGSSNDGVDLSSQDEKKRKLAKRIMEMTNKIEDLSNQLYHLQQRIEVLERKQNPGF